MRTQLNSKKDLRIKVSGKFTRYGCKRGWKGSILETVLITELEDELGNQVADHIWLNNTQGFSNLNPKVGDIIEFEGRVKEYEKGYKGWKRDVFKPITRDFKLSHPTKFRIKEDLSNRIKVENDELPPAVGNKLSA